MHEKEIKTIRCPTRTIMNPGLDQAEEL